MENFFITVFLSSYEYLQFLFHILIHFLDIHLKIYIELSEEINVNNLNLLTFDDLIFGFVLWFCACIMSVITFTFELFIKEKFVQQIGLITVLELFGFYILLIFNGFKIIRKELRLLL